MIFGKSSKRVRIRATHEQLITVGSRCFSDKCGTRGENVWLEIGWRFCLGRQDMRWMVGAVYRRGVCVGPVEHGLGLPNCIRGKRREDDVQVHIIIMHMWIQLMSGRYFEIEGTGKSAVKE